MACCGKTCSKVSVCIGLLLAIGGIALALAGALSLANISINVSAGIDGAMTGTLAAPSDLACPYTIFIEKVASCTDFTTSAVVSTGASLDTSLCGGEELPDDGPERAPARRGLQDLDWTIGASETPIVDLKLAATVTFSEDTDVTLTSGEDMWSMQLCDVFAEVFEVAGRAIIMVAVGVVLLVAGLITCTIGLCCCCCCAPKE
mmetsp:Transcript_147089/g.208599  ORF Transcript_147089/g.208599 Transcript_147089/m.208599 type:complete len:203 (+) Transcript_147089:69-677(+)|eukprot:s7523_g3.t1